MSCKDADALARDIIAAAGYGDAFGHGLGHGVGLAVHELPTVGKLSEGTIEAGMIFTVEPGVYIPGWGGVRIEDVVLVTNDDVQVLSRVAKRMSPSARRRVSRRR
jgi:Xaa-Pro aminopeptidase